LQPRPDESYVGGLVLGKAESLQLRFVVNFGGPVCWSL